MLTVSKQVFVLKLPGPPPPGCLTFIVPPGRTTVSMVLPMWSTPAAVKAPQTMMLAVVAVPDVVMIWMCSVPVTAAGPLVCAALGFLLPSFDLISIATA